ncbi:MAG: DUF192 domain-containing protein [Calothrix sp. MO_167.B42]|nr:DUF192 domain-containing protein [Calothrix sp. MO_167.B42]
MIRWFYLFSVAVSLLIVSCSAPTPAEAPMNQTNSPAPNPQQQGQELPISAIATFPNGSKIKLEVARTPEQQAMGLMYRPALPDDRGMLFQFPSPQPVSFWMFNVRVPLDMVFIYKDEVKAIAAAVPPCKKAPCPTYGPSTPIDRVIELRSGRAAELGLKVEDKVKIDFFESDLSRR